MRVPRVLTTIVVAHVFSVSSFSLLRADSPDYSELKKYANLASLAYCIEAGIQPERLVGNQKETCPSKACQNPSVSKMEVVEIMDFNGWFELGSGLVIADHKLKTLHLVFQGTASTEDWLSNLDWLPAKYQPLTESGDGTDWGHPNCQQCKIHHGFRTYLRTNAEPVIQRYLEIRQRSFPDYGIAVSGHSLGGALATLTGIELRLMGHEVLVVTFGGPKIGNRAFANYFDSLFGTESAVHHIASTGSFDTLSTALIRVVHRHDLVPHLPPTSKFRPMGYEYYLSTGGQYVVALAIERRATDYVEDETLSIRGILPDKVARADHVNYFFRVTSCRS